VQQIQRLQQGHQKEVSEPSFFDASSCGVYAAIAAAAAAISVSVSAAAAAIFTDDIAAAASVANKAANASASQAPAAAAAAAGVVAVVAAVLREVAAGVCVNATAAAAGVRMEVALLRGTRTLGVMCMATQAAHVLAEVSPRTPAQIQASKSHVGSATHSRCLSVLQLRTEKLVSGGCNAFTVSACVPAQEQRNPSCGVCNALMVSVCAPDQKQGSDLRVLFSWSLCALQLRNRSRHTANCFAALFNPRHNWVNKIPCQLEICIWID